MGGNTIIRMGSKSPFNSLDPSLLYKGNLLRRMLFTIIALFCIHLGILGINHDIINDIFPKEGASIFGVFNLFSIGALARIIILVLNVMSYIVASSVVKGINEVKIMENKSVEG